MKDAIMAAGNTEGCEISTWSRSYSAKHALSIGVQELYAAHVDTL